MPESITVNTHKQLFEVTSIGEVSVDEWKETLDELILLSEKTGIRAVVFDVQQQKVGHDLREILSFAKKLPMHFVYASVIGESRSYSRSSTDFEQRFLAEYACQRGILFKACLNQEEAHSWIEVHNDSESKPLAG